MTSQKDGGLRSIFRTRFRNWQWSSIETPITGGGIPDTEFCSDDGFQGWVEFKKTHAYYVQIKPLQVAWLTRRHRLNSRCFIAVRRTPHSAREDGVDELWLMGGDQAQVLSFRGLAGCSALCWSGGPNGWNYEEIANTLKLGL